MNGIKNGLILFALSGLCWFLSGCVQISMEQGAEKREADILDQPMTYQGQIVLRMAVGEDEGHPSFEAAEYFAEQVGEKTDHRVRIVLDPAAGARPEEDVAKEICHGSVDLALVSADSLTSYDQRLIVLEMPFQYLGRDQMWQALDGEAGAFFLQSMTDKGIRGLCWYDAGARNIFTVNKAIHTPEDLDQMRIQVNSSAFLMDVVSAMGAFPMALSDEDRNEALKSGQADGIESDLTSYLEGGCYRYAGYAALTEHIRIPQMMIINQITFEQLGEELGKAVCEAAEASSAYQRELWEKYEKEQRAALEQAGVVWAAPEDQKAFQEKLWPIYEIYGHSYTDMEVVREKTERGSIE